MDKETLYRFFRKQTSELEELEIMDWIDASEINRDIFNKERELYDVLCVGMPAVEKERTFVKGAKLKRFLKYAGAAAAIVAVMFVFRFFVQNSLHREFETRTTSLHIPAGQRINIELNDGTTVWLNSGTSIEYPLVFGKERRVRIDGEAIFDVTHDPKSPFIVETYSCNVEVLGTRFYILAEKEVNEFSATLFEGKIKVTNLLHGNEQVIMAPGDKVSLSGTRLAYQESGDQNEVLWTEGIISLENITFEELMKKFEKYYDYRIVVEKSEMPKINITRGKIKLTDGIDHAMKVLQMASDFTYRKQEDNRLIIIR